MRFGRRKGGDMPMANVNGVQIFFQLSGTGEIPLVLVHGSWVSHRNWDMIAPGLAESFRVLAYDRRGHSQSPKQSGQGSVREDVADLAALIEDLGLAPAWIVGSSFGASITLKLAAERPELFRGLIAHEPPLSGLLAGDPVTAPMLEEGGRRIEAVAERIAAGDHEGAAEQFIETVALGPGTWAQLPLDLRKTLVENAPTYLDEVRDPEGILLDLERLEAFDRPTLLTRGDQSPPTFGPVVERLAGVLPRVEVVTFPGAGHIPHVTHSDAYAEAVTAFVRTSSQ
jgi:pimeloyl-ACP methyl ester carboxylesterase